MALTERAYALSESLLAEPLPRRWAHSLGVAKRAASLRPILGREADLMEVAAVLHDIGYSPSIATTGFHPWTAHGSYGTRRAWTNGSCASWPTTPARSWRLRSEGSGRNWQENSRWSGPSW